ncbi:hypothetical protein Bbelb_096340 [Branchiostoma belcheri]|nr:hypothetical protein Bbelb_096340 [Branchiostoma belcheri]
MTEQRTDREHNLLLVSTRLTTLAIYRGIFARGVWPSWGRPGGDKSPTTSPRDEIVTTGQEELHWPFGKVFSAVLIRAARLPAPIHAGTSVRPVTCANTRRDFSPPGYLRQYTPGLLSGLLPAPIHAGTSLRPVTCANTRRDFSPPGYA